MSTKQEWYEELVKVAKSHGAEGLVQDFKAWTENWETETPKQAFYHEYPEYEHEDAPNPNQRMIELAQLGYQAYCVQAGGVTFDGKPLPTFDELGENRQQCWIAAATAISQVF